MNNNSDGLSPSLRPLLGVGWNRALPAPFGFDKGYTPNGSTGYFVIPRLIGKIIPNDVSFEVFFKNTAPQNVFFQIGAAVNTAGFNMGSNSSNTISVGTDQNVTGYGYSTVPLITDGSLMHLLSSFSRSLDRNLKHGIYKNGGLGGGDMISGASYSPVGMLNTFGSDGLFGEPITISRAVFGIGSYIYSSAVSYSVGKWDEFRMYKRCLTAANAREHWNLGIGNNPSSTEYLIFWYKFQEFETLDFSEAQDGSDMRLGLRDHSGNNNHAQPINMDTNPASPNYVLKPF